MTKSRVIKPETIPLINMQRTTFTDYTSINVGHESLSVGQES